MILAAPLDGLGEFGGVGGGAHGAVGRVGVGGAYASGGGVEFADVLGEIPVDSEQPLGSSPYGRVSDDTRPACLTAVGSLVGVPDAVLLERLRTCGDELCWIPGDVAFGCLEGFLQVDTGNLQVAVVAVPLVQSDSAIYLHLLLKAASHVDSDSPLSAERH